MFSEIWNKEACSVSQSFAMMVFQNTENRLPISTVSSVALNFRTVALTLLMLALSSGLCSGESDEALQTLPALVSEGKIREAREVCAREIRDRDTKAQPLWTELNSIFEQAERCPPKDYDWPWIELGDKVSKLGLQDLAIEFYQRAIRSPLDESDRGFLTYRCAQCAVRKGDYQRAVEWLNSMDSWTNSVDSWNGAKMQAQLLSEFAANPTNVALRVRFAREFWVDSLPVVGSDYSEAIKVLSAALALHPTDEETKQLYSLLVRYSLAIGEANSAKMYLVGLKQRAPKEGVFYEAAFSVSQWYFSAKQYTQARDLLQSIIESATSNRWISVAHLGLAEVYERTGDDKSMLEELELAAASPPIDTHRSIMDASNTQQIALRRLGDYYKTRGQVNKALEYFVRWKPTSWCGNGAAQFAWERDLAISECLLALGRTNEALNAHLMPHLTSDRGALYQDYKIPQLVVTIYEYRDALKQLRAELASHTLSRHNRTAALADKLAQIRLWSKEGNIDQLVTELHHGGGYVPRPEIDFIRESNWPAVTAAHALAEQGGKEVPALMRRFEELASRFRARPDWSSAGQGELGQRVWVIYALSVSKSPNALTYLKELESRVPAHNRVEDSLGVEAGFLHYAISLHPANNVEQ